MSLLKVSSHPYWVNVVGTSERRCKCLTWRNHWKNHSRLNWPNYCTSLNWKNEATLGAHIRRPGNNLQYIAPLCGSCNNSTEKFRLEQDTIIVSANRQNTCD